MRGGYGPLGHAVAGGRVTINSGGPWRWRWLAGEVMVARCTRLSPRGPNLLNYLRERMCGCVRSAVGVTVCPGVALPMMADDYGCSVE